MNNNHFHIIRILVHSSLTLLSKNYGKYEMEMKKFCEIISCRSINIWQIDYLFGACRLFGIKTNTFCLLSFFYFTFICSSSSSLHPDQHKIFMATKKGPYGGQMKKNLLFAISSPYGLHLAALKTLCRSGVIFLILNIFLNKSKQLNN